MLLIMSCAHISLSLDNTLSPEVKPTEVPSESVPQTTHGMMEGNRKEAKKKKKTGMTTMWMRERRVVTAPLCRDIMHFSVI